MNIDLEEHNDSKEDEGIQGIREREASWEIQRNTRKTRKTRNASDLAQHSKLEPIGPIGLQKGSLVGPQTPPALAGNSQFGPIGLQKEPGNAKKTTRHHNRQQIQCKDKYKGLKEDKEYQAI